MDVTPPLRGLCSGLAFAYENEGGSNEWFRAPDKGFVLETKHSYVLFVHEIIF